MTPDERKLTEPEAVEALAEWHEGRKSTARYCADVLFHDEAAATLRALSNRVAELENLLTYMRDYELSDDPSFADNCMDAAQDFQQMADRTLRGPAMTDEQIERVARAIKSKLPVTLRFNYIFVEDAARAAIEAMEPTSMQKVHKSTVDNSLQKAQTIPGTPYTAADVQAAVDANTLEIADVVEQVGTGEAKALAKAAKLKGGV